MKFFSHCNRYITHDTRKQTSIALIPQKNVLFLRYWPRSSGQGRLGGRKGEKGNKAEARRVVDPLYGQVVFHRKEQREAFSAFRDIASRA